MIKLDIYHRGVCVRGSSGQEGILLIHPYAKVAHLHLQGWTISVCKFLINIAKSIQFGALISFICENSEQEKFFKFCIHFGCKHLLLIFEKINSFNNLD